MDDHCKSMAPTRRAVVVMAKQPEPGATKTRLSPRLTPDQAASIYESFLLDALDLVRSLTDVDPFVAVAPSGAEHYFRRLAPDIPLIPQIGSSLGQRLDHVLTRCLDAGYEQVVAIGSDIPTLPAWHLERVFDLLSDSGVDVVLGPSEDGGYHMVGWKRPHGRLVRAVEMSTPDVLEKTLELAAADGVSVALAPRWYDVDRPEDLDRARRDLRADPDVGHHTRAFLERELSEAAG